MVRLVKWHTFQAIINNIKSKKKNCRHYVIINKTYFFGRNLAKDLIIE